MNRKSLPLLVCFVFVQCFCSTNCWAQIAVRGQTVYTMSGPPIEDGVVLIRDGKIATIGAAGDVQIPDGFKTLEAAIVTPGLVDARSTVGLSGIFNVPHDQDQLERSGPIQPELRALDAYNTREALVDWVRSFGVTTVHTGHAPGELVSGQTIVVKTHGSTVDKATLIKTCAIAATLGSQAQRSDSPGTRGKMMAMLREQFIKAQEYRAKHTAAEDDDSDEGSQADEEGQGGDAEAEVDDESKDKKKTPPSRDLRMELFTQVLDGELPLLITAHRAQDIASSLRLADEFGINIWLDGASEAYLLLDEIKAAGVPVFIHPLMARPVGDRENMSFETPAELLKAGIPVVFQSSYEDYVPKTRVVLFEAAMAAANGLTFEQALAGCTIEPARILGIDDWVGSLEVGKDGDLALYDGDPFEYTTHCIGTVIEGEVVSDVVQ